MNRDITTTEYEPDDELRDLLDEVLENATVSYGDEQDLVNPPWPSIRPACSDNSAPTRSKRG